MRGRSSTQPFLVEIKKGGSRLSPQRNFSPAPLGNPVAPSSVTFGDSFPPKGKPSQVVHPCNAIHSCATPAPAKCASKSGHVHGPRNSPTTAPLRPTTPKRASGNERAIKKGVQGACPRPSFPHFSGEMGTPAGQAGPPGRCAPRHRKSPDHPKGTQYPTAPPPGNGREPTPQGPPCAGPNPAPYQGQPGKTKPPGLGLCERPRPGGSDIERENSKQGTGNLPCPARFMRLLLAWCSRC